MAGYRGFGSFTLDTSVEELMLIPEAEWVAPARPVADEALFDASAAPPAFGRAMRTGAFFLDPSWTFLNHGAFGGAARVSLSAARLWAEYAESQPLRFIDRELFPLAVHSVRAAAALVRAPPRCCALVPNATYALSSVIGSLPLAPGATLFCLDVGYGSVRKMLEVAAARAGGGAAVVVGRVPFPLPRDPLELAAVVSAQIPPGCALAVFDHVTSNAGLLLPVAALVAGARGAGVRAVLVDGAHGLGALDLDLPALGADYYVSNAHKWLASSKGLGLLYVAPSAPVPRPAVVSHGYGAGFASEFVWDGCRDYAPAVALPALLAWWRWVGLDRARAYCRSLCARGAALLAVRWGTRAHAPRAYYSHMACVQLPPGCLPPGAVVWEGEGGGSSSSSDAPPLYRCTSAHSKAIQDALHHAFACEVPAKTLPGPLGGCDSRSYVRVSAFIYNTLDDFEALAAAVLRIAWDGGGTAGAESGAAAPQLPTLRVLPPAAELPPPLSEEQLDDIAWEQE